MVIKTYIDKSNTLISNSELNVGLNPITELFYGDDFSRYIFHFDIERLRELSCNGTFPKTDKLTHTLHMTNTASINGVDKYGNVQGKHDFDRATSFELILFAVPQSWDGGKGYNYNKDIWVNGNNQLSNQGSNWFQAKTGIQWGNHVYPEFKHAEPGDEPREFYDGVCNGIYDNEYIHSQYDKYKNGEKSIIITSQLFDIGNENLSMDITDTVNKLLNNEILYKNHGFCLMFAPYIENIKVTPRQYVGFFTQNTSSFFEPYIETKYDDYIKDDRNNFYIDKENRLYFYSFIGGQLKNLHKLPKCRVMGNFEDGKEFCVELDVEQCGVGIYYVEFVLSSNNGAIKPNRMFYDEWVDLVYKSDDGTLIKLDDVKMEFVTMDSNKYYNFMSYNAVPQKYEVVIGGIRFDEELTRGEVRKVIVDATIQYTRNQSDIMANMEYRIYTKNGGEEMTIIDYLPMNRTVDHNFFYIDTMSLLPQDYIIDIKTISNGDVIIHKAVGKFKIINHVKEIYK